MRHRVRKNSLGRASDQRKAMLKHLVRSLLSHGRVETTVLRAKQARPLAERVITYGKRAQLGREIASAAEEMMSAARDRKDASATLREADRIVDLLTAAIEKMPEGSVKRKRAEAAKETTQQIIELAQKPDLEAAIPLIRQVWLYGSGLNVALRRQAQKVLGSRALVKAVFEELAPEYMDRPGGYTRVIKTGLRRGDAAQKAVLELVE